MRGRGRSWRERARERERERLDPGSRPLTLQVASREYSPVTKKARDYANLFLGKVHLFVLVCHIIKARNNFEK